MGRYRNHRDVDRQVSPVPRIHMSVGGRESEQIHISYMGDQGLITKERQQLLNP